MTINYLVISQIPRSPLATHPIPSIPRSEEYRLPTTKPWSSKSDRHSTSLPPHSLEQTDDTTASEDPLETRTRRTLGCNIPSRPSTSLGLSHLPAAGSSFASRPSSAALQTQIAFLSLDQPRTLAQQRTKSPPAPGWEDRRSSQGMRLC
jgi:hypothetical protein